jgi:DnaJ domain
MFIKTKQSSGRTYFFLCIAERGGNSGDTAKVMEHSVCLGETLKLTATRWREILRASSDFRRVPLTDVLKVVEAYVAKHGLSSATVAGLREAVYSSPRKKGSRTSDRKEPVTDEYATACKLLGIPPGSSDRAIESAFRRSARRHHPDVGGDPAKFRAILAARDLLLGRDTTSGSYASSARAYDS